MAISKLPEHNQKTDKGIIEPKNGTFLIWSKIRDNINEKLQDKTVSKILVESLIKFNIDKVILILTDYSDWIDFEAFSEANNELLLKFFKKLIKGKSWKEVSSDMWFNYIFDIEKIIFFYNIFWNTLELDDIIKANLLVCLSSDTSFKRAYEIHDNFPTINFGQEAKISFQFFIQKHALVNLDIAIIIKNKFSNIDFADEIRWNELNIKTYLKKAWKKYDIERIAAIKDNFWSYISIDNELCDIFVNYIENCYWNAKLLYKHMDWIKFAQVLNEFFLKKIMKREITQAKKIITDFWDWIDFTEEIKVWANFLEKEFFLEKAKKVREDLL